MYMSFKTIEWRDNKVIFLDQRKLPAEETYVSCENFREVTEAIKNMTVRGAPAIGVAGAMGTALSALDIRAEKFDDFFRQFLTDCNEIRSARPTAVNLSWAVDRITTFVQERQNMPIPQLKDAIISEALKMADEDVGANRAMGVHGEKLISNGDRILTHCNAGALATAGFGTALGVLYTAKESGKNFSVIASETRPFLQGARLTAWELEKNNIPVTLITDNMAGWMMKNGEIDKVIVGADRIAVNGDVANKIGTYTVAVLAKVHDIPFYVAAPLSTIDLKIKSGDEIPIEERGSTEVTHIGHLCIAPQNIKVKNPAFDVTPHWLVTAIITEKGVIKEPYFQNLVKFNK